VPLAAAPRCRLARVGGAVMPSRDPECYLSGGFGHNASAPVGGYERPAHATRDVAWVPMRACDGDDDARRPAGALPRCACRLTHYSQDEAARVLARANFTRASLNGDSVMQGFVSFFEWLAGGGSNSQRSAAAAGGDTPSLSSSALLARDGAIKVQFGLAGMRGAVRDIASECRRGRFLGVFNFGIQHVMWHFSLDKAVRSFEKFASALRATGACAADDTLVFFDSVAVHGFREPYCTLERSRRFSAEIARALRPAGFRVLSAYGVTEARPDSAVDGMHPSDDMYFVMAQLLLNAVELERAGGGVA
jgi:hypothetical protein